MLQASRLTPAANKTCCRSIDSMINSYSGQSVSRSVWVLLFFGFFTATNAATQQYSRFEVGAAFSGFQMLDNVGNPPFNYGFAGQFDWNVSRRFAFETQIAFFPKSLSPPVPEQGGRTLQVLAGVRGRVFQRRRFALYGVIRHRDYSL